MIDTFEKIVARALEATGKRNQVELSEFLEIRPASISEAKRRGNFPSDWLIKIVQKKKISPLWISHGEGPMYIGIDQDLLRDVIAVFESCILKLKDKSLIIDPENKAKWISFFYDDFSGKGTSERTIDKIEDKIYGVMKLPKIKG